MQRAQWYRGLAMLGRAPWLPASWAFAAAACGGAAAPPSAPVVRIDAATGRLWFAVCSGAKVVRERALYPREVSAVVDLVARLQRTPSPAFRRLPAPMLA